MTEKPEKGRYEHRDINFATITKSVIVLVVIAAVIHLGVWWLYDYLRKEDQRRDVRRSLVAPASPIPPQPRLQINPQMDFQQYLREQQEMLNSYGWVSRSEGIVRIPIARAMEMVVEEQGK